MSDIENQVVLFQPTDAAIAVLEAEYMPLRIDGIDDTAGYRQVHAARMNVKAKRVEIEKTRKKLKADTLAYGRKVDREAKRLTAMLEPIETHLLKEEKAVDDEKERIRNAIRLKREAEERAKAEAEEAARKARREAEEAELRAERERLDVERRAVEAERAAIHAEKLRLIELDNQRIRDEQMEKAKAVAAKKARIETETRIARKAAAKLAEEKAHEERERIRATEEAAARAREEALRPDREKIRAVAAAVNDIVLPELSNARKEAAARIHRVLVGAAKEIERIADETK